MHLFKCTIMAAIVTAITATPLSAQKNEVRPYQGVKGWAETKDKRMEWYRKARFGLFIHWGLYAAAGGSWDGKVYPQHYAEWIQTWAKIPSKEYAQVLKPKFTASKFDPKFWAMLAKNAGMKYVVVTARHHEGFSIFNSQQSYSLKNDVTGSTNISPAGRDLYKELVMAFRAAGLKIGAYYSLWDWQNPDSYDGFSLNKNNTNYKPDHEVYKAYLYGQIKELATNYGGLDLLWPDFSTATLQGEAWGTQKILTDVIKWNSGIIICNRFWDGLENRNGDFGTPEKYVPPTGLPGMDWEVSHTMNESYGYSAHDNHWKSYDQIMRLFIETVSKGGNFLLNIGPDAEGVIPERAVALLEEIGQWMKVNSSAIYATTASPFQTLDWGYCTQKPGRLYLTVFDVPTNGLLDLPLKSTVKKAYILGNEKLKLLVENRGEGKAIRLPAAFAGKKPMVIVAEIPGKPEIVQSNVAAQNDGRIILNANNGRLSGTLKLIGATTHDPNRPNAIGNWTDKDASVYWDAKMQRPGRYKVIIIYKPAPDKSGVVRLSLDGSQLSYKLTAAPGNEFKPAEAGTLEVSQRAIGAASVRITLSTVSIEGALPEISSIVLIPEK